MGCEAQILEDQGLRLNKEVDSLLSHPKLPEVCQDPSLKGCVDLLGKHENVDPEKCMVQTRALWRKARP